MTETPPPALPGTPTVMNPCRAPDRTLRRWTIPVGLALVLAATTLATWLLADWVAAIPFTDPDKHVPALLEVAKLGAAVAVGGGGLIALYLTGRRQRTQELELANKLAELDHTRHDATERRVTELYLKAVEQLGSDKPVVRMGGLYALERLGQENPAHRQTVVNVICGYLREPFTPPSERPVARRAGLPGALRGTPAGRVAASGFARRTGPTPPSRSTTGEDLGREREVRLTAQRILAGHLRPDTDPDTDRPTNARYWPEGYDLDLTAATLVDLDLTGCRIGTGTFTGARFDGAARFDEVKFTGDGLFAHAKFRGGCGFAEVTFAGAAIFERAQIADSAVFRAADFTGVAIFDQARFPKETWFDHARFTLETWFIGTEFSGYVGSDGVRFMIVPATDGSMAAETASLRFDRTLGLVAGASPEALPPEWTLDLAAVAPLPGRDGLWAPLTDSKDVVVRSPAIKLPPTRKCRQGRRVRG